jgi:hypothetical protein
MPLPSSGTINLSDVIKEFGIGTNNSVNLFTSATSGTVTAPVTGYVIVEVRGGGGGGGGFGGATGGGGGGSAAYAKELIYINSGQTLNYIVGAGGAGVGGSSTGGTGGTSVVYSGTKTITTIGALGGAGGKGGAVGGSPGQGGAGGLDTAGNTNIGITTAGIDGDNAPGSGIAFGGAGTVLGDIIDGSGLAGNGGNGSDSGNGSNGNDGAVKFTWYDTTKNLRGYLKAANTNVPDFYKNDTVPTSGTMELRDFLSTSAVGFKSNALLVITNCGGSGATNSGTSELRLHANGRYDLDGTITVGGGGGQTVAESLNQQWCTANGNGGFEPRRLYAALFQLPESTHVFTGGSAAVNTWFQLTNSVTWTLSATGEDKYINANLCISTTSSNTGLISHANIEFEVIAAGSN